MIKRSKQPGRSQQPARSMRPAQLIAALIAAAWLAGCSTPSGTSGFDTGALEREAAAAAQAGDLRAAADLYRQLAESSGGTARAGYLLAAAQAEEQLGNLLSASELLGRARSGASESQLAEIELVLARIDYAEQRPAEALERIRPLLASSDTQLRAAALEIQGLAQFALDRPVEAIEALSEREVWLNDVESIRDNQRLLWDRLGAVRPTAARTGDPTVDGWLALAPIARVGQPEEQRRALLQWRQDWRQHPAARFLLTDLLMVSPEQASAPRQIALLLPLSTNAREPARAIRDGFLAAHLAAGRDTRGATAEAAVRVYDTGTDGAEAAYLRAQIEGADFIVGPLFRESVDAVLPQSGLVPTLTLNHSLSGEAAFGNTFQFALAPEDEAIAVARRAIANGQRRAVALIPSNDRGYRIFNSFREQYEAMGGEVLSFMGYDSAIATYGTRISTLLNLDRSNSRENTLQSNLREDIEFAPRRRQDIDMIFLIANAGDGRQLAPQLEYFYAGDIPTYSISEIHDPAARDRVSDLNRVIFPEVPWLIAPGADTLSIQRTIANRWPQRSVPMARFFGMGLDSYRILTTLYRDPFFTSIDGATGMLSMDSQGRIHRDLPFAQFRGGTVEPIDDVFRPRGAAQPFDTLGPPGDGAPIDEGFGPRGAGAPIESGFGPRGASEPGGDAFAPRDGAAGVPQRTPIPVR